MQILLKLEYVISIIGTAKTIKGNNIASVATFITPVIEIAASKNPENNAPLSPINIFAGLKLKVKNASIAPARIKPIRALIGFAGDNVIAKIAKVIAFTVTTEPASPSTPSIKFTAFEIPTIQSKVIGYESKPKSIPPKNGTLSICTPKRYAIVAIETWIKSLNFAPNPYTSSIKPNKNIKEPPSKIPDISFP